MKKFKRIDVALYVFILTGLGYFATFLYGWGYNNYFSIPIHFIDFSILNITKSITIIGIGLSIVMAFNVFFLDKTNINQLFSRFSAEKLPMWFNYILQFICLLGIIVLLFCSKIEVNEKKLVIYFWIGLFFVSVYFYLKKYKNALIVAFTLTILLSPYIIGLVSAERQTEFYLISEYEDYVIVTFTNTKIISAKYDSEKNAIYPIFKVLPMDKLEESKNDIELIEINEPTILEPNVFN